MYGHMSRRVCDALRDDVPATGHILDGAWGIVLPVSDINQTYRLVVNSAAYQASVGDLEMFQLLHMF